MMDRHDDEESRGLMHGQSSSAAAAHGGGGGHGHADHFDFGEVRGVD
jgi:hypothetical protein